MLHLNVFMELKLTSIGRLFQTLITLSQKKVQHIPVLCGLKTLYLWPLVWGTELSVKNWLTSISTSPKMIL